MDEKILNLFRKHSDMHISGEEISRRVGITRAAVWKHIEKLRQKGYNFEAVPHLGYRLVAIPDRLFPEEISSGLNTGIIGRRIFYYDTINSTNIKASELAEKNYPQGTIIVSETQAKGKGRLSREWFSPKYRGIYCSIILKPEILPVHVPKITLLAAVSITATIRRLTNLSVSIRWPNDILINKRKICGILTEMNAESDKVNFLILGIGINVTAKRSSLPEGATSLAAESAMYITRVELLKNILFDIEAHYNLFKKSGFAPIVQEWQNVSSTLGKRVRVLSHKEKLEGHASGIDSDGALILRMDNGFQKRILAGDVRLIR